LAFQIADDILDAQGGIAVGERTESSHKERKKATYPSVVGIVTAKDRLTELLRMSLSALDSYETQAEPLRARRGISSAGRFILTENLESKEGASWVR
jgi:geranylgeranyl pyrophosphate synthase